MRAVMLALALAACSDPTNVAPEPSIGAIAGTIVFQANQQVQLPCGS